MTSSEKWLMKISEFQVQFYRSQMEYTHLHHPKSIKRKYRAGILIWIVSEITQLDNIDRNLC